MPNDTEDPFPWPIAGEEVFKSDAQKIWSRAWIPPIEDKWELYAIGYKEGADILVRDLEKLNRKQDFLVYPIVFLYRHYLELHLKHLIKIGKDLLDIPQSSFGTHNLIELWKDCRKLLEKIYSKDDPAVLNDLEECIKQFQKADPFSMVFRYPEDKKGNKYFKKTQYLNIEHLAIVIKRCATISARYELVYRRPPSQTSLRVRVPARFFLC